MFIEFIVRQPLIPLIEIHNWKISVMKCITESFGRVMQPIKYMYYPAKFGSVIITLKLEHEERQMKCCK
jgi:hypothetical protein